MSRRGVALLLIGIGVGTIFVELVVLEYIFWSRSFFGIGVRFRPESVILILPFLLIVVGLFLLRTNRQRT